MNVLLDTCALLALANGTLPSAALRALGDAGDAFVSSLSCWEVAIKHARGKLLLPSRPLLWFREVCRHHRLAPAPLTPEVFCEAAALPALHSDPFDRVLVATALREHLLLLTSDRVIPTYPNLHVCWSKSSHEEP